MNTGGPQSSSTDDGVPPPESPPTLSIVIPLYNEEQSLDTLLQEIAQHCRGLSYEVVLVDDGSSDRTADLLQRAAEQDPHLHALILARNYGQTQALSTGFRLSRGSIVVFLDGDLQNDPADIPLLVAQVERGADVVSGWRRDRRDNLSRRVPSAVINRLLSRSFGLRLHDIGCTLKAYRREVLESMDFTNDLHRYLPLYAQLHGYRIEELEVHHRPRIHGASKYGLGRVPNVLIDVFLFVFLARFLRRPMQFFGKIALAIGTLGVLVACAVIVRRIFFGGVWLSPAFFVSFVAVLMSFQLLLIGIVCELVTRIYVRDPGRPICRVKHRYGRDAR
jgi:glycosyltransferase involved in cell wall biosynthesis